MSIYVLRSDNLVKIGFSDQLRQRVRNIVSMVPVPVEFVGYMPGGRDVEKHLHRQFAAHRFSGEWFVETSLMTTLFDALLIKGMPAAPSKKYRNQHRERDGEAVKELSASLRDFAASTWPTLGHMRRIEALTQTLDWNRGRVKDLYYADPRISLRANERDEVLTMARALYRPGTER